MSVYSAEQLNELATNLCAVEAWLRESPRPVLDLPASALARGLHGRGESSLPCTARHNDDMADMVEQAWHVIEGSLRRAPSR